MVDQHAFQRIQMKEYTFILYLFTVVCSINKDFNKSLMLYFITGSVPLIEAVNQLIFIEGVIDKRIEVTDF